MPILIKAYPIFCTGTLGSGILLYWHHPAHIICKLLNVIDL